MNGQLNSTTATEGTVRRITTQLTKLPPDSLALIEQLVQRLHTTSESQPVPYMQPTVVSPATSLLSLTDLLQEGYEGDALADSEALYDGQA